MAGEKGNKKHANKTSFTSESRSGVPAYEKWTEEKSEDFLLKALEIAKRPDIYLLEDIYNELNIYDEIFDYLISKYPKFRMYKILIKNQILSRINRGALKNELNAIFAGKNLSANYGWAEKRQQEIIQKTPPKIEFE